VRGYAQPSSSKAPDWTALASGAEIAEFKISEGTPAGDSTFVVIRIDPGEWNPRILALSNADDDRPLTALEWVEKTGLPIVTNAGMFAMDRSTHVGYMRTADGHVNSDGVNHYKSAAAFAPMRAGIPAFRIFDLDRTPMDTVQARYQGVVQNLRLIKRPGENRWSEMALAEDEAGHMLLAFSRSPYRMHVFNEILLGLPIGVVAAQHLEGGPEASLAVTLGESPQTWMGSWETNFYETNENRELWPIPNAIGFERR
jgi:hypothetical protein